MPQKKLTKGDDPEQSTSSSNQDSREGKKLAKIGRKLSQILTEIESRTDTIKQSKAQFESNQRNTISPTLTEMTQAIAHLSTTITERNSQPQTLQSEKSSTIVEEAALRIKTSISNLCEIKLQKRRDAYWSNGYREVYKRWIAEEPILLLRYL